MDGGEIDGNVSINIITYNKPPSCKARHHYIVDIAIAERWPWLFWIQFNGSTIVIISPLYKWHWQCSGGFYEKGGLVESWLMVKSCWQLRETRMTPFHSPLFILTQNCAHFTTCHNFYIEETVRVQKFVTNSNTKISRLQIRVTNTNTRHPRMSLSRHLHAHVILIVCDCD